MSLTSQLDDAGSPFATFMSRHFPAVKNLSVALNAVRPPDAEALRPDAPEGARISWITLNSAIDHRLRCAFSHRGAPAKSVERGIAAAGRLVSPGSADAVKQTGDELTSALGKLIARERPATRSETIVLSADAEQALDRICYAMAWFEEVHRSRRLWPGTPLGEAKPDLDVDQLLEAVPAYAVADMSAVVKLADSSLADVRDTCPPERIHTGPALAGSTDVGGTDVDLIADDLLLEFKSTITPSMLGKRDFYQVLGYLILDYEDRYGVRRLGFYLSRFGRLVIWTVEDYLALLGSRRPLDELRQECAWRLGTA